MVSFQMYKGKVTKNSHCSNTSGGDRVSHDIGTHLYTEAAQHLLEAGNVSDAALYVGL